MGGQACVLYGAAEFSRDTDVAVVAEPDNLERLSEALNGLQAECIAVPPFSQDYLRRGHAVHLRCSHPDVRGTRIDVMAVMRGVAPFGEIWERRTTFEINSGLSVEVLSLPDLVQSKKTQRDKDWPMIRRLMEAHHARHQGAGNAEQIEFWLREVRTVSVLVDLARRHPDQMANLAGARPLLSLAAAGDEAGLAGALEAEEKQEREVDRVYWAPLRKELEALRHRRRKD
jgi:hypothetical protein